MVTGGGIGEGVAGHAIWSGTMALVRQLTGRQIEIVDPRPQAALKDPKPLGQGISYRVRGKLRRLTKDHRIWLLIENERTGEIWPQGFQAVQYDPSNGEWEGRVNPWDGEVRIHAVVAPPTADDFFRYFQQVGDHLKEWRSLRRIPVECINRATVQASKP